MTWIYYLKLWRSETWHGYHQGCFFLVAVETNLLTAFSSTSEQPESLAHVPFQLKRQQELASLAPQPLLWVRSMWPQGRWLHPEGDVEKGAWDLPAQWTNYPLIPYTHRSWFVHEETCDQSHPIRASLRTSLKSWNTRAPSGIGVEFRQKLWKQL